MLLNVETTLDASAETIWQAIKQPATFVEVTAGVMAMSGRENLPDQWFVGQMLSARLTVLRIASWTHHLRVLKIDETRREMLTEEHGGMLKTWNHRLTVLPLDDRRCRYGDQVDVRAGILTPVAWMIAHAFFRYRQYRLRKLAKRLAMAQPTVPA